MTDQSLDSKFLKIVGPAIFSAVGAALAWLAGRSGYLAVALTTVLTVVGGISALAFSIMYRRYLGVLASGGARKGSPARAAYDALRESLAGENVAMRFYIRRLRDFLDWTGQFFRDARMVDRTLFPRAFGLNTPAPLWTAPAFDRCLLLALIYPVATIFLIWTMSGHVGPAESALGLQAGTSGWRRSTATASIFIGAFAYWWVRHQFSGANYTMVNSRIVLVVGVVALFCVSLAAFAVAGAIVGPGAGAVAGALTSVLLSLGWGAGAAAIAAAVAGPLAFVILSIVAHSSTLITSTAYDVGTVVSVSASVGMLVSRSVHSSVFVRQHFGPFLAVFALTMILICIGFPLIAASGSFWKFVGPNVLFVGLLTLVNAPFDWASLGLTRALLRRGLELGAWWPYFFALIDAVIAAVIIMVLAVTMVVSVQAFDAVAVHSGGLPILPLSPLFDGLAAHSSEPEYWWIYALLISSMIPSLINLAIGGASFLRGVPGLRALLLSFLPIGKAVPPFDRAWIALVLTAQTFLGIGLGVAAQAVLAIGIIGYVMPWFGLHILDVARDVADYNLPEEVWALVVGTLRP
jgi:hypothetical protein